MDVHYDEDGGEDAMDMPHWGSEDTKIRAYHYPFCCSGVVLSNLGGSDSAFVGNKSNSAKITSDLKNWITWFRGNTEENKQFISVCTTDEQGVANDILTELGFECTNLMNNTKYDNKLMTWILPLNGYAEQEAEEKSICVD